MKKNFFLKLSALLALAAMTCVGCKDYSSDISDLNTRLKAAESSLSSLSGQVTTLESSVSSLQGTVTTLTSNLNDLKTKLAEAASKTDVDALKTKIAAVETAIADAQAAIEQAKAQHADLLAAIEKNGKDISANTTAIEELKVYAEKTYATIATVTAIQEAGTKLIADVKALETKLDEKVTELQTADADLAKALQDYKEEMSKKETDYYAKAQELYNGLKNDIASIKDALTKVYTKDEVDALVEALQNELTELEAVLFAVAFQIENPFLIVQANYGEYIWKTPTTKSWKNQVDTVAAVFPEIKDYKKGDALVYATSLPFYATAGMIDKDVKFSLVDVKGNTVDATFEAPVEGIAEGEYDNCVYYTTNAESYANKEAWSVKLASFPTVTVNTDFPDPQYALVADNGAIKTQTGFTYEVDANAESEESISLTVNVNNPVAFYEEGKTIDLLGANFYAGQGTAAVATTDAQELFKTNGPALLHAVFVATDKVDVDRYGIVITEGHLLTLTKGTIPANPIALRLVAVGYNGTTAGASFNLTVSDKPESKEIKLPAKDSVVLGVKDYQPNDKVLVAWPVSDFGLSLSQLSDLIQMASTKATEFDCKMFDVNAENPVDVVDAYINGWAFLDKNYGAVDMSDPDKAAAAAQYFAVYVKSSKAVPGTYALTAENAFVTISTQLTILNPAAQQIKVIDALLVDGVLQFVGTPKDAWVTYDLTKAFVTNDDCTKGSAAIYGFVDLDKANAEFPAEVASWIGDYTEATIFKGGKFVVPVQGTANAKDYAGISFGAKAACLDKVRKIGVTYNAFNNVYNQRAFSFDVKSVSPMYSADGSALTSADATLYTTLNTTKKQYKSVDVRNLITGATFTKTLDGYKAGNPYQLFATYTTTGGTITTGYLYGQAQKSDVKISEEESIKGWGKDMFKVIGTDYKFITLPQNTPKEYLFAIKMSATQYAVFQAAEEGTVAYLPNARYLDSKNGWNEWYYDSYGAAAEAGTVYEPTVGVYVKNVKKAENGDALCSASLRYFCGTEEAVIDFSANYVGCTTLDAYCDSLLSHGYVDLSLYGEDTDLFKAKLKKYAVSLPANADTLAGNSKNNQLRLANLYSSYIKAQDYKIVTVAEHLLEGVTDKKIVVSAPQYANVASTKFSFYDETAAKVFFQNTVVSDPYNDDTKGATSSGTPVYITVVKPDGLPSSFTSQDFAGKFELTDAWGMVTIKDFKITVVKN